MFEEWNKEWFTDGTLLHLLKHEAARELQGDHGRAPEGFLLTGRGMLRENGLMDRAKTWVALDRMKVSDLFGRRK